MPKVESMMSYKKVSGCKNIKVPKLSPKTLHINNLLYGFNDYDLVTFFPPIVYPELYHEPKKKWSIFKW